MQDSISIRGGMVVCLLYGIADVSRGVPIINGGLETGDLTGWLPGPGVGTASDPWGTWGRFVASVAPPNPVYQPPPPSVGPAQGNYFAVLHHDHEFNATHSLFQDLQISAQESVLNFWLYADLNPQNPYGLGQGSWGRVTFEERCAGGKTFTLLTYGGTQNGAHYRTNGWQPFSFNLAAYTAQTQLRIRFELQTANNTGPAHQRFFFDKVALVPEPGCLVCFAPATLLLMISRRAERSDPDAFSRNPAGVRFSTE